LAGRVRRHLDAHAPDLVHIATEGPLGTLARRWALDRAVPLVTSFHTDFPRYCTDWHVPALAPAVWRWISWFHRPAQVTHAPGEQARRALHAHGVHHAVVWGTGVDTRFFHPERQGARWRMRFGVPEGRALVLHVGRLAPEKNLEVLIEAFRLARRALGDHRATFVVAGDGPRRALVDARLPWARRLGFLDRADLADLYAAADCCVLPSASETCGLVALEALATGVPVIAANAGGLAESVRDGVNGQLANPDDPRAFAAHIVRLVLERDHRATLRAAARASILHRDAAEEDYILLAQYEAVACAA
jgi:glycosyltransferase involved in cell wall biosynthesis